MDYIACRLVASNRIPALDGLRGIAILLVLVDHLQDQWGDNTPLVYSGQHGVNLFFVLSGFLITSNLLKQPNLKAFYVRRFFRLMPVAWCYLLFLLLVGIVWRSAAMTRLDLVSCLLFFRNYIPHHAILSPDHYWSLSIEEQFYLAWPAILLLSGKSRARWILVSVALACAAWRLVLWNAYYQLPNCFRTEVRIDAICVGCLLALLIDLPRLREGTRKAVDYLHLPALVIVVVCIFLFRWLPPLFESCAMAILIAALVLRPERFYSRALAFRPLAFIGVISYSIYVWQHFFLLVFGDRYRVGLDSLLVPVALASYYLLERPGINLGRKLTAHLKAVDAPARPAELSEVV